MKDLVYLEPFFSQRQEWKKIRQKIQRKMMETTKYKEIVLFSVVLRKYKEKTPTSLCHVLLEHVTNSFLMPWNWFFSLHPFLLHPFFSVNVFSSFFHSLFWAFSKYFTLEKWDATMKQQTQCLIHKKWQKEMYVPFELWRHPLSSDGINAHDLSSDLSLRLPTWWPATQPQLFLHLPLSTFHYPKFCASPPTCHGTSYLFWPFSEYPRWLSFFVLTCNSHEVLGDLPS